ncbi:pilin [Ostreibacterium oceani]|uniref:Uncharacterized protein n=1 Tax=Ostreibacterium oceani TaxID=2654998 RepID=A0A6N7ERF6_9GAMM|nr:pilin [Ostreibacterium oceani]MPV85454.1 hypothetical protein [Ostreibacterium oceani]
MKKQSAGYTLFEFIFVATIIGVLAAVSTPAYLSYETRARSVEGLTVSAVARQKIAEYYRYTHDFPKDNVAAGVKAPDLLKGAYTKQVEIIDGVIHITYNDKDPILTGKMLTLHPVISEDLSNDLIFFKCGYIDKDKKIDGLNYIGESKTNIDRKYLPGSCR